MSHILGIFRKRHSNRVLSATPLSWFHTIEGFSEPTQRSLRALNLAFCVSSWTTEGHCQVLPARCRSLRTPSKQKQLMQTLIACLYDNTFLQFTLILDCEMSTEYSNWICDPTWPTLPLDSDLQPWWASTCSLPGARPDRKQLRGLRVGGDWETGSEAISRPVRRIHWNDAQLQPTVPRQHLERVYRQASTSSVHWEFCDYGFSGHKFHNGPILCHFTTNSDLGCNDLKIERKIVIGFGVFSGWVSAVLVRRLTLRRSFCCLTVRTIRRPW